MTMDRCTPADVTAALVIMRSHFPAEHPAIDEMTAVTWHAAGVSQFDPSTLNAVALGWGRLTFPSSPEFVEACVERVRAVREAEREAIAAGQMETVGCPECGDQGGMIIEDGPVLVAARGVIEGGRVVTHELAEIPSGVTVRPCRTCRPEQWWLWSRGHRAPNHRCSICKALAKGDRKPLIEAMAGGAVTGPRPDPRDPSGPGF